MDFALTDNQESIRDAVATLCRDFDDAYWLNKDREGGFPFEFHKAMADAGWLGVCIPEEYGGSGLGITEAAHHHAHDLGVRRRHVRRLRDPHEHLRPQSGRRVRQRRAAQAHAAADGGRQAEILLRGHRAEHRPEHHAAEAARRAQGRPLRRQRPEGVDLHRAGRRQDAAAGAHHAAGGDQESDQRPQPVLHRLRPQARAHARDREDGPQGGRLQRAVLREFRDPGGGPHRRGRPRLRIHPARDEPGAHPRSPPKRSASAWSR